MDINKINSQQIRRWFFIILAFGFQVISFYASYEGIQKTFIEQAVLAVIFAASINLALLGAWHEFQKNPQSLPEGEGFAKRRSLAFSIGLTLLLLSGYLSSLGMYSFVGFKTGSTSDSDTENSRVLQQTKDIYFKVKDVAAKNLDTQKNDLAKKLDTANKRLAQLKSSDKRRSGATEAVRQIETKIKKVDEEKDTLASQKPVADEKLTVKQRNAEIQTQISNLISDYSIERDKVLSADDKKVLTFDAPVSHNLYDQFMADLKNGKPLAYASIAFGVAPDIMAILLLFVTTPRKKLPTKIRDAKIWTAEVWQEIKTSVALPFAVPIEVLVIGENDRPLLQTYIPIDLDSEVSEETVSEFFPQIISELFDEIGRNFEIRELPDNWRDALTADEPLELRAVEV